MITGSYTSGPYPAESLTGTQHKLRAIGHNIHQNAGRVHFHQLRHPFPDTAL
jgi:hypothetical protein